MRLGSVVATCLLLAGSATAADEWHMNQSRLQIPIRVQPNRKADIRELNLYVSTDRGRTWQLHSRARPDQEAFTYQAPQDGSYWFSVTITEARTGHQDPVDVAQAPVGQKVVIDTTRPDVQLTAERQGDDVVVRWDVKEDNADLASLKLEYRTSDTAADLWSTVQVSPSLKGQGAFKAPAAGVSLRMQVQDQAGNAGTATAEVGPLPGVTQTVRAPAPAPPPPAPISQPPISLPTPPPPSVAPPPTAQPPSPVVPAVRRPGPEDEVPVNPPAPPAPLHSGPGLSEPPGKILATSTGPSPTAPLAPASVGSPPSPMGRGSLPPVQVINRRQVRLEFEVAKVGPSGLGGVDVYMTTDDGQTWGPATLDPTSPPVLPADLRGASTKGSVSVQMTQEGVTYGFCVVVKSRANLSKPPPQRGDLPQLRVELDTTIPSVNLRMPQPDAGHRDALVLVWEASDKNLASNPVTIEWAEKPDGPWSFIGSPELPNTGRYTWQVPPNVPPSVFLRITVRDVAGNNAVAQTREPVLVDLSVPEVSSISLSATR